MLRVLTCLLKLVFLFFSLKRTHGGSITLSSSTRTSEEMDRAAHFFSYLCDVLICRALTTLNSNRKHRFETFVLYCYENWCQILEIHFMIFLTKLFYREPQPELQHQDVIPPFFFREVVTLLVAANKKRFDISKEGGIASWFQSSP